VHEPDSRGEISGTITLEPGAHTFEYYHAAGGDECCMVAAWTLPGGGGPARISPNVFRFDRVLRVPPTQLEHRDRGYLPDFRMAVLDDIPSAEVDQPAMVRVQFVDASAELVTKGANYSWSFGDGQASEFPNPGHVFLQPGEYPIRFSLRRRGKDTSVTNRIYVTRQFILDSKGQEGEDLESYMETLKNYNSVNLNAAGLVQLVRAYLSADDPVSATQAAATAFFAPDDDTGHTDVTRWALAKMAGPAFRTQLDNPVTAAKLWTAASGQIKDRGLRAASAIEAADVLLNDLLLPADAKANLDFAEQYVGLVKPIMASKYYRVLGDWQARGGNAADARSSYIKATARRELSYTAAESAAWRGAHAQSIEAFLRSRDLDRAREELEKWQVDFPRDKTEGYYSFLLMQYWVHREKFPQALAVASDLMVVNPRSPYIDRVLFLSAKCHEESKQIPRAIATLRSLLDEHPGSPLVEPAKRYIERLAIALQNKK
jgi:TolA-binding protein